MTLEPVTFRGRVRTTPMTCPYVQKLIVCEPALVSELLQSLEETRNRRSGSKHPSEFTLPVIRRGQIRNESSPSR